MNTMLDNKGTKVAAFEFVHPLVLSSTMAASNTLGLKYPDNTTGYVSLNCDSEPSIQNFNSYSASNVRSKLWLVNPYSDVK